MLPDAGRTLRFTPFAEAVLPLTLTGFSAVNNKTNVFLSWSAMAELNSKDFEVQRSTNGLDFRSISTIVSRPGTNSQNSYSYTDVNIAGLTDAVFYRLKQNDHDGNSTYSNVLKVRLDASANLLDVKAQNPVRGSIKLQLSAATSGSVSIVILNVSGVILLNKMVQVREGANSLVIKETASLARGIYFLQCRKLEDVTIIRLLKE